MRNSFVAFAFVICGAHLGYSQGFGVGDPTPDAHLEVSADGSVGGDVVIVSSNDANDGDLFTIKENGKIGIATNAVPFGGIGMAKLGINGLNASTDGPHIQVTTSADNYPLFQVSSWAHDNVDLSFDAYYDGAWKSSDIGSNFQIGKSGDQLVFNYDDAIAQGGAVTWNTGIAMDVAGRVGIGTTTPNAAVEISFAQATNPSNNYGLLITNTSNSETELRLANAGVGDPWTLSANNDDTRFRLFQANEERMRITVSEYWFYDNNDRQVLFRNDASAQNDNGWTTAAVDYGEFMEKLDPEEEIGVFEIVGVKNGKITKNTEHATAFMVTSTNGGLRGGNPVYDTLVNGYASRDEDPNWMVCAFVGQVPVAIEGEVNEGDYIVPSGLHDGKARAISKDDISLEQFNQLIGMALEGSDNPVYEQETGSTCEEEWDRSVYELTGRKNENEHIINVAVNLNFGLPTGIIKKQEEDILTLTRQTEEFELTQKQLVGKIQDMEAAINELKQLIPAHMAYNK